MSVRATFPMFLDMEREHRSLILAMLKRRKAAAEGGRGRAARAHRALPEAPARTGSGGARPAGPKSYFYSFKGGLQDLSDAIVASLPAERLHAGTGVKSMAECGAGCGARPGSGAYALELSDGTRVVADAVVLATPAWASGDLLRPVAPLAAADLSSIEYVTTATASVAFRRGPGGARPQGLRLRRAPRREPPGHGHHVELEQVRRARARRATCCCAASSGAPAARPRPSWTTTRWPRWSAPSSARSWASARSPSSSRSSAGRAACRSTAWATSSWSRTSRPPWPGCRASSSPAAPTTASASATACARARPPRSAPSSTSAASPRTRSRRSRRTSPPPTASD